MTEWQPIETAPKDGARVDIWVPNWDSNYGRRFTDAWFSKGHWWYANPDNEDDVFSLDGGCHLRLDSTVTHWMPSPEPPGTQCDEEVKLSEADEADVEAIHAAIEKREASAG